MLATEPEKALKAETELFMQGENPLTSGFTGAQELDGAAVAVRDKATKTVEVVTDQSADHTDSITDHGLPANLDEQRDWYIPTSQEVKLQIKNQQSERHK